MIYTVTFNPALDYVVRVEQFSEGIVNRANKESLFAGGKGLNVSAILKELGHPSTILGFAAGFTGDEIERRVKEHGIACEFVHVKKGMSRINIKLKSDRETEINGIGPEIEAEDTERLLERLDRLDEGDVLVLSGSIPKSVDNRIYEIIMERLECKNVLTAVDASGGLLLNVLKHRPFLIKPNHHELEEIFGSAPRTRDDIVNYARRLRENGAVNVLVSLAGDGAILVAGDDMIYQIGVPGGTVINSVGAGDSMVAGFIAGYLEKKDYEYALKLGTAAGSATAYSEGLGRRKDIIELLQEI